MAAAIVQCVVGCAIKRGVEVRLRRRVAEPDPCVELGRSDVVGIGAIVAVDDPQVATGHLHVVRLGVGGSGDVGHRHAAVDHVGRAGVEEEQARRCGACRPG